MKKYIFFLMGVVCFLLSSLAVHANELNKSDANIIGHVLDKSTKEHLSFESPTSFKTSYALTQKLETLLPITLSVANANVDNTPESLHVMQKTTTELKELVSALKTEFLKN